MNYLYGPKANYEDFASGRVLYHAPGVPNYPVRLQAEIFFRCLRASEKQDELCVYDPCCGGGGALTTLGFLFGDAIARLAGSDIDPAMTALARKNLALLSRAGLERRAEELRALAEQYGKPSHREALESCTRLMARAADHIRVDCFEADCTRPIRTDIRPDIILTDVPYGNLAQWRGGADPAEAMLSNLRAIAPEGAVLAVSMDKVQKPRAPLWRRVEKQNVGRRRFEIFVAAPMDAAP